MTGVDRPVVLEGHQRLVTFQADVATVSFDAKGHLVFKVVVVPEDKWLALPITDIRGRRFVFDVWVREARVEKLKARMAAAPVPEGKKSLRAQWVDDE